MVLRYIDPDTLLVREDIVACVETICSDGHSQWTADSVTDARGIQLALTTTDFVSALVITNYCLNYLQALTTNLQAEARDVVESVMEISSVKAALQDIRDNIMSYHSQWFKKIKQILASVGEEPSLPQRYGCQCHCSNVPADTPCEYYCHCISILVVDHLHVLSEMETRLISKWHCWVSLWYHPLLYLFLQKSTPPKVCS